MKIRQGFVSNSSSSSFICFGVRLTAADKKRIEDEDTDFDSFFVDEEQTIIGDSISISSEDGIEEIDDLDMDKADIAKRLSETLARKITAKDIKIFTGTEYC